VTPWFVPPHALDRQKPESFTGLREHKGPNGIRVGFLLADLLQNLVRDIEVGVSPLDIVMVFQRFH
jgi:hypothetical protein